MEGTSLRSPQSESPCSPSTLVDHSLDVAREAKNKLEATKKAHADADKKLKETPCLVNRSEEVSQEC